MKVASVIFREQDYQDILSGPETLLTKIWNWLKKAQENQVEILVLPALIGYLFDKGTSNTKSSYLKEIIKISINFDGIAICPGTWGEKDDSLIYHSSGLIKKGHWLLQQKQLYLARWEREFGLSRGTEIPNCQVGNFSVSILVSTDMFYPQTSRYAALSGVDLVLAPTAIKGPKSLPRQLSGLWQQVQQNSFFAVESGYTGSFQGQYFDTDSLIHAPLTMTPAEDGLLRKESQVASSETLLIAELSLIDREKALNVFNPLNQLNPDFYLVNLEGKL